MLQIVASGLVGCSIIMLTVGIVSVRSRREMQSRLARFAPEQRTLEDMELERPFAERVIVPTLSAFSRLISRLTPQTTIDTTVKNLRLAGSPNGIGAGDFVGVKGFLALFVGGFSFVALSLTKLPVPARLGLPVLLCALGFMLPNIWLGAKIKNRQAQLQKALPDALDLLTICVQAGLGFDSAMAKVATKWDNALSREFGRVIADVRVGRTRTTALKAVIERTGLPDINTFVSAIVQAEQLGVSVSRVLQVQSEQIRIKHRQRVEEIAQRAPIKMLFPMVFFIFPALFVVILGPAIPKLMRLFSTG